MKKITLVACMSILALSTFAQKGNNWEALENMKKVMKQTFPPVIKQNDLSKARLNAKELYQLAQALETEIKPKAFRKKSMEPKFAAITSFAKIMDEQARNNASDEDIKNTLVSFHAAFAEIAHHKKAGHDNHGPESPMKGQGRHTGQGQGNGQGRMHQGM